MSRRIAYAFEIPWALVDEGLHGVIEVADDATDEEIEEEVKALFFELFNYGWSEAGEGDAK